MKHFLILAILLFFVGYSHAGDLWPQNDYAHVVAYCYDHSVDDRGKLIVQEKGGHSKGIVSAMTIRLNKKQIDELRPLLLSPPKEDQGEADCYLPHHAFVFYDKDWNVKAHISICFGCGNFKAVPANIPRRLDFEKLQAFVKKIGMPIYRDLKDYGKLYKRMEANKVRR